MGPLVAIEGTLDGERYKQLLAEYLKPEIDAAELPMVFMQDNARNPVFRGKRNRNIKLAAAITGYESNREFMVNY